MARSSYLFTSESVSEGHPDKICDRISDSIVDAYLSTDQADSVRCGVETLVTTNYVCIAGETRGPASVDHALMEKLARQAIRDIGYDQDNFHWENAKVDVLVHNQSADIAQGVDSSGNKDEGAGDQGLMFGYACNETEHLMPAPIHFSHEVLRRMADARKSGAVKGLGPDSKSQFTLEYRDGKPVRATSIVVSTQHDEALSTSDVREIVRPFVMDVLPDASWMCPEDEFYVNPTGRFVIGGPDSDAGLTGRKIIVDTYGGAAPHGGGAFSGKDPSKVDRSAAYATRYLAKNVVAAGLAEKCTIQVAYAIGVAKPLSLYVDTHGTIKGGATEARLEEVLPTLFDLSPRGIRQHLNLNRPIYTPSSSYGHFGRQPTDKGHFSWEKTDLVDRLLKAL
ncbi:MAG: methionine adenosyltransferase [Alphaproteobacteria bacterium]|nr:methionine adenosyltransferase [Alphaproteobacteria bacterium]MCB9928888.1 methionine adenosyltransferase [Alphaproteobacteria bacterium]